MSKDEMKQAAWKAHATEERIGRPAGVRYLEFCTGFDAGYEAATAWREIKSEDDLPKEKGWYLVTDDDGDLLRANFTGNGWRELIFGWNTIDVIAWMPLPASFVPKEGKTNE